ncbi:MAG TPA: LysM peptidoglycan-binding domain-containing protein [Streptosporangiaceae bacterium]|nr:LysM peptidoglycan-binding domain-containing protein [Streptosporangiaceae bacterium]
MPATPYPAQPPPAVVQHEPAQTARTVPDPVYVVQPGDNLWSIAQKFYGSGFRWADIYHANEGQLGDPNVIYAGQKLLIPQPPATAVTASQHATVSAVSAAPVRSQSNPQYYFELAAQETGMPLSVVKAQCYVESSDGTNDGPSVTGAMGPWQFEPYTWAQCSPAPFSEAVNWAVSTQVYITYMKQLLQWSHGNIQMALAAYNAGQGNWQAGLGYAGEILSIAGLA